MSKQFFLRRGAKIIGPRSAMEIKRLVSLARVIATDELASHRDGPWLQVSEVKQLAALIPSPPIATGEQVIAPPKVGTDPSESTTDFTDQETRSPTDSVIARIASRGKQAVDSAITASKNRVAAAFAEAMSRVDETETLLLQDEMVLGRGSDRVDKVLPHPQVSLRHARIRRVAGAVEVVDLGSDSGTFVDGQRIQEPWRLQSGQTITIGPYSLRFDGKNLVSESSIDNAELVCRDLTKTVSDSSTGEELCILNRVTLMARPREFLVVLGPSGSGKSTLISALSGRSLATSGDVVLNGSNLYANFDALKKSISLVPQQDILFNQLDLKSALSYTAQLRLPPDLQTDEIDRIVTEHLAAVDLAEHQFTRIGNLSGGQVKRASVANEIISEPSLLFIDEATSGLDEHTDGELMQVFRQIAEAGKTVVCITHNLTNVEKYCHRVAILAPGGYLAFVGTPAEALEHFQIDSLGEIYARIKDQPGQQWREQFESLPECKDMYALIDNIIGSDHPAVSPTKISRAPITHRVQPTRLQHLGNYSRQFATLMRRGWQILWADSRSLWMLLGQCLFVATLIVLLLGDASLANEEFYGQSQHESTAILFLLAVSAFWFGCNNSAKELVKERAIYERERAVSLNVFSYFTAKFVTLASLTTIQIAALLGVVSFFTSLPGTATAYFISLTLSGLCGVSLGLLISAFSSNTDVASTAVPIAIIPQVILAGMISQVGGLAKLIACIFVTTYWSFGSLLTVIPSDVIVHARPESLAETSYARSLGALLLHLIILNGVTLLYLYADDKRWTFKTAEFESWLKGTSYTIASSTRALRNDEDNVTQPNSDE